MYGLSLVIPVISVSGVVLGGFMLRNRRKSYLREGYTPAQAREMMDTHTEVIPPNWYILGGSGVFVVMTILFGLSEISLKKEIIFIGSLAIIGYLMAQLLKDMQADKRREIVGIAIIIFVFRAMPTYGAGASWWQIDVLGFDEAFFGTLRQIASILAIAGMFALRGWMSRRPVPYLVVFLSVYTTVMSLPYIGMYFGLHEWTQANLGFGQRTIALIDTMADSPLGQVAMIPMLAWIAKEAPRHQKATYFAVMAAFTNIALSASQLLTNYMNKIFVIERGRYDELGLLMITVTIVSLVLPVVTVMIFNPFGRRKDMPATR
jgi:hypothetical protein